MHGNYRQYAPRTDIFQGLRDTVNPEMLDQLAGNAEAS